MKNFKVVTVKAELSLEPFRVGHPLEAVGLVQLLRLHTQEAEPW